MEAEFLVLVETKKKCAWNRTQYQNAIKEVGDKFWSVMRKCQPLRDAGTRPYEAWRSFLQNYIEPKGRKWGFEKENKNAKV
jgi:hypothetical protein